jgi:glycine/D-amino acid oxidase-like deaminating enzyme
VLFPVIQKLLETKLRVRFYFNAEPAAYQMVADGVQVTVHARTQTWEKRQDSRDPSKTGILTLTRQTRSEQPIHDPNSPLKFDHVIISTGAAVSDAFAQVDPNLAHRDLFPVFGYIVVGEQVLLTQEEERKTGIVDDDYHQYIRSTKTGAVAMGGGMSLSSRDDATIEALAYDTNFGDAYMAQSALGQQLLQDPGLTRQGGVRPISKYDEFPILKSHQGGRIIINTGGGAFGYSIYWKSAELVTQMVYGQGRPDPRWAHAVQTTEE